MSVSSISSGFTSFGLNALKAPPAAGGASTGGVGASSDIEDVRKMGLVAFAKKAKEDAWKDKLDQWEDDAKKSLGLTPESMAAMSPEELNKAMKMVKDVVQQKIKSAMDDSVDEGRRQGKLTLPQFVDFSA